MVKGEYQVMNKTTIEMNHDPELECLKCTLADCDESSRQCRRNTAIKRIKTVRRRRKAEADAVKADILAILTRMATTKRRRPYFQARYRQRKEMEVLE